MGIYVMVERVFIQLCRVNRTNTSLVRLDVNLIDFKLYTKMMN